MIPILLEYFFTLFSKLTPKLTPLIITRMNSTHIGHCIETLITFHGVVTVANVSSKLLFKIEERKNEAIRSDTISSSIIPLTLD